MHLYFFRAERLYLIDRQIEQVAAVLISSDLSYKRIEDYDETDDYLSDLLGRTAINLIVLLRDSQGGIIYENENAAMLKTSLPTNERWQFLEIENYAVRVLTIPINRGQRTLQAGLVLNQNLLRWKLIGQRVYKYIAIILFVVFLVSLALRRLLLKPLDRVATHLRGMAVQVESGALSLESITSSADKALGPLTKQGSSDEFAHLVEAVRTLALKIQENHQATQRWTAQMVHELKTPLTIIRNQIESATAQAAPEGTQLTRALSELDALVLLIDEFLEWNLNQSRVGVTRDLHVIKLAPEVERIVASFERLYPGRISLLLSDGATVFAKPSHLHQLLNNLITNALKYSPDDKKVRIAVSGNNVTIADEGPGIPNEVLANKGKPFNRGQRVNEKQTPGFGLGLAWATTIAKLYGWELVFKTGANGTIVELCCNDPEA